MKSDGVCKNAAAAVNFRLKSLAEFFAAHGEKINQIHFCRGRVPRQKYFSLRECRAKRGTGLSANFFPKNLWFFGKQNKTERSPAPFRYMVEDKMKKMKNCYLQLLIYPKDVSY